MSSGVPPQGTETRSSLLPTAAPSGLGFFGSPYSPADAMPSPPQVGVSSGSSMSNVVDAVKGVAFYTDMIGFGAPSSGLTDGMPVRPLGINYFMKTGASCSNGADMYMYFQGIPQGNAMGARVAQAMQEMGMPPLKGLAPGMIEDAESALNPAPLMSTLFGTGYPQCKQSTLMVGDPYGNISDPADGTSWIDNTIPVKTSGGQHTQTCWIQDTDALGNPIYLTEDQWNSAPKTYNPDGTPVAQPAQMQAQSQSQTTESFVNAVTRPMSVVAVGLLCILAFGVLCRKSR